MDSRVSWTTMAVFALTYLGLALGRVPGLRMDRAAMAFVGATLMLVLGGLTLQEAVSWDSIDYETLFLLFGMMVVVGFLRLSGFMARITIWSLARIESPRALLRATILLAGLLSAFLVNDVVCVAITPVVFHLAKKLRFDPLPHLVALATAANIGSCGTMTGNPQNMIIGVQSHISYSRFAAHLMPVAMLGLLVDFCVVSFVYRKRLGNPDDPEATEAVGDDGPVDGGRVPDSPRHRRLQKKSVTVAVMTIGLLLLGLPIVPVAMGAASILLMDRVNSRKIFRQVDWSLLLMFTGLFIVVHALELRVVSRWDVAHWHWLVSHPVALLTVAPAALSNLVSNVPAVLLFEPIVRVIPPGARESAWLSLAMASTLAGNLTILGSVANLIVVENAKREGLSITFWEYGKVGVPVTLATLGIGVAWLHLVH